MKMSGSLGKKSVKDAGFGFVPAPFFSLATVLEGTVLRKMPSV